MTPLEIKTALEKLRNEVGPRADLTLSITADEFTERTEAIRVSLYPFGVCSNKGYIAITADTFDGAVAAITARWAEYSDEHRLQTTRNMALAIIRLTTETGDCTDAALRQDFDAASIARWGDDACKLADQMAGKGPFRIKRKRGANAAA